MNKGQLVETVLSSSGGYSSRAAAERAVNAVLEVIRKGLKSEKKVQVVGFGTFSVRKRAARTVRTPNGEMKKVKARRVVHFKPGKALNEFI
ncbi:MAG: HU family DNA-binding protein [Planctomycetota bacterium]|jgi:DNA-binding protein HU-beta